VSEPQEEISRLVNRLRELHAQGLTAGTVTTKDAHDQWWNEVMDLLHRSPLGASHPTVTSVVHVGNSEVLALPVRAGGIKSGSEEKVAGFRAWRIK